MESVLEKCGGCQGSADGHSGVLPRRTVSAWWLIAECDIFARGIRFLVATHRLDSRSNARVEHEHEMYMKRGQLHLSLLYRKQWDYIYNRVICLNDFLRLSELKSLPQVHRNPYGRCTGNYYGETQSAQGPARLPINSTRPSCLYQKVRMNQLDILRFSSLRIGYVQRGLHSSSMRL